jgi:nitroreductase
MKPLPNVDHPLHDLVLKRWSPRSFAGTPLTDETILTLFEAARFAASCNNYQPWRFIYATRDQVERHGKLFECLKEFNQTWVKTAPLLVLTIVKVNFDTGKPNLWAKHDLGLAIGNLTMQAMSMGIYVHNMAGFDSEQAAASFNLGEEYQPVTMIAIGRLGNPDQLPAPLQSREEAPQTRKPLSELIMNERFPVA